MHRNRGARGSGWPPPRLQLCICSVREKAPPPTARKQQPGNGGEPARAPLLKLQCPPAPLPPAANREKSLLLPRVSLPVSKGGKKGPGTGHNRELTAPPICHSLMVPTHKPGMAHTRPPHLPVRRKRRPNAPCAAAAPSTSCGHGHASLTWTLMGIACLTSAECAGGGNGMF